MALKSGSRQKGWHMCCSKSANSLLARTSARQNRIPGIQCDQNLFARDDDNLVNIVARRPAAQWPQPGREAE